MPQPCACTQNAYYASSTPMKVCKQHRCHLLDGPPTACVHLQAPPKHSKQGIFVPLLFAIDLLRRQCDLHSIKASNQITSSWHEGASIHPFCDWSQCHKCVGTSSHTEESHARQAQAKQLGSLIMQYGSPAACRCQVRVSSQQRRMWWCLCAQL